MNFLMTPPQGHQHDDPFQPTERAERALGMNALPLLIHRAFAATVNRIDIGPLDALRDLCAGRNGIDGFLCKPFQRGCGIVGPRHVLLGLFAAT